MYESGCCWCKPACRRKSCTVLYCTVALIGVPSEVGIRLLDTHRIIEPQLEVTDSIVDNGATS
jgi:hypothetical protein